MTKVNLPLSECQFTGAFFLELSEPSITVDHYPTSEANEYATPHGLDLISQTGQKSHQSEMISL